MTSPRIIVGAGLAGLIAAHAWPMAEVCEAQPKPAQSHRALLRFRGDAVARLTGTEFRKVRVHKGIWHRGAFAPPSIAVANLYAMKCLGRLGGERSIWNIEPVDRWIAPDDFYAQLLANVGSRVDWGNAMNWPELRTYGGTVVSTAPLPEVLNGLGQNEVVMDAMFRRAPISVLRFEVAGADVYQTVYFPGSDTKLYRASLCGSTLIAEFATGDLDADAEGDPWATQVRDAFGLSDLRWAAQAEASKQRYGKIAQINDTDRRRILFNLTHNHGIFSLGRFATWRNLLLDDVVDDIAVIKRLMRTGDAYELRKQL